ncbi:MAG: hypothetical protein O3C40_32915 [Planctomycetota bacterium]|nr:hypothetical protein [Planctomycetota bacterium]
MTAGQTHQTDNWGLEDSIPATRRVLSAWRPALLLGLMAFTWTSPAPAQDLVEVEEEELVVDQGFEMSESNFDQWIFGVPTSDHGRKRVESLLTLNVEAINHVCGLTEDQVAKLELAGQGDIKRFYDDVAVLHDKFMKVRRNRNAVNNFYQELLPLQARVNAGLFKEASFFRKVLNRTLNDEQSSAYEAAEWERGQFRYHAKLALVVSMIERTMPLRAEQRERFIQVLKEETQPPKAFGQYDYYVVLYQLGTVPDLKLKPIFDEAQWKVFQQHAAQGQAMGVWLKQQKLLP